MLLTITTNHRPATDLGYLLAKHPDKAQAFGLAYGQAHVFYPRADEEECTACLLLVSIRWGWCADAIASEVALQERWRRDDGAAGT